MYPQTTASGPVDYDSMEIASPGNTYIMRARLASRAGAVGRWSTVMLPQYQADDVTVPNSWQSTTLTSQTSSLDVGTQSTFFDGSAFTPYVSAVNINLVSSISLAVTGANVWFRWMPSAMFESAPPAPGSSLGPPLNVSQKEPSSYVPSDWQLIGSYTASSFTTAIPRKSDPLTDTSEHFQILVTHNTTIKPDKYNYRWVGNLAASYKLGEPYNDSGTKRGYLPWNPGYGAAIGGTQWSNYARQRTTMQDIALFYPRRWRV